jgi:hypothetical protein
VDETSFWSGQNGCGWFLITSMMTLSHVEESGLAPVLISSSFPVLYPDVQHVAEINLTVQIKRNVKLLF